MNFVDQIDDRVEIRRALISVYDKAGLDSFVPGLLRFSPRLTVYSTGGTYRVLEQAMGEAASEHLVPVSAYTGQPEMQGGLVKTLDFKIYLGLLSERYNSAHARDLERAGAESLDMVVVNLYPFRQTVARSEAGPEQARANIDIGGPCMLRAAAKNFLRVAAVVDPGDYPAILNELQRSDGRLSLETRYRLARKAFGHTAEYDAAIASYLEGCTFARVRSSYEKIH